MTGKIRIGVSGWRYSPWRGNFYPKGLAQSRELHYASRVFESIELNGSFYSLQWPTSYAQWAEQTPEGFVFAIKGSRYITHMLKLRNIETALANFFASGLFELGDKLGPLLWQFPAMTRFDPELFDAFFSILPRTTGEAMWIACAHDDRPKGRVCLEPLDDFPLRHAVEVRHASFETPEFIALLERHNMAFVVADTPNPWPKFEGVTADFAYMRLHGATELYQSRYTHEELAHYATLMRGWADSGRDVYCYFDNTDKLHAPDNAQELMEMLGLRVPWQGASVAEKRACAATRNASG
ncbi:DUF72 domain-containing protein [Ramlibacter sp. PS4R-6]|uniref:DUF72 domain-containing protein n=1 Tax=Ramlibacter sp. PS4R-6 TaxID=3133438 RepID=UPI003099A1AC